MMDFEECLTFEIKSWLQRADQGKNIGELIYEVADIQLAFDNNQMMNLLAKRANALRKRNFAKAKRIQEQMTKYKNENFEKLFIPKKFFCTFRTEYAYHKALEVNTFQFQGEDINIAQAQEPTDIIWENRHFTKTDRRFRFMIVVLVMSILALFAFLVIILTLKQKLVL